MRSSPNRICGFITPSDASTSPVAQVREVAGDRRRADVERDAERPIVQARPDAGDRRAVVDRDGDAVVARSRAPAGASRTTRRGRPRGRSSSATPARAPRAGGARSPPGVASVRPLDLDVVQPHDRVDHEVADGHALAHDLAMDLALGRHVDERRRPGRGRVQPSRRPAARPRSRSYSSSSAPRGVRWPSLDSMPCFGNEPSAGTTWQRPQMPRPPHTESMSTPSERAASSTVVPGSNRPRRPDGVKMTWAPLGRSSARAVAPAGASARGRSASARRRCRGRSPAAASSLAADHGSAAGDRVRRSADAGASAGTTWPAAWRPRRAAAASRCAGSSGRRPGRCP